MTTKLTFVQSITAGAIASGVSVVINGILFLIFHSTGILTDDIFIQPDTPITIVPIIISSIIPTLIGASVFFLLEKYTQNGFKIFTILSVVLVGLSFINPFMLPKVTMGYAIALNVMHLVVAGALWYFISTKKKQVG